MQELNAQLTARDEPTKAFLYSGHDTTVGPLLACLGAFDGRWPKYASNVALELLVRQSDKAEFVQLRYNGRVRALPRCAAAARDAGVAPELWFASSQTSLCIFLSISHTLTSRCQSAGGV